MLPRCRCPALLGGALLLAGCGGEAPPFAVEVRVSPTPATVGTARVLVEVRGPEGAPVEGASVSVRPLAPDGTATGSAVAEGVGAGLYVLDALPLHQPGSWTLGVRAVGPAGAVVERSFPLRVVGPPPASGGP